MPTPIDDNTLDELAKTNPDLVAQYRAKMQPSTDALKDARDMQSYGNVANVAGKALNDLGNANRPKDAVLYNRMDQLGKAPTVVSAPERAYDDKPINNATGQMVSRAEEDKGTAQNTFNEEQKLTDSQRGRDWQDKSQAQTEKGWGLENARNDPTGAQAKQAGLLLKNALLSKASEADEAGRQGVPGASEAAQALREQAKTAGDGMSAADIMAQHKLVNDSSYDKVLEMRVKKADLQSKQEYRQGLQDDRQERATTAATAKDTAAQAKVYRDTKATLETARGNPSVAQAEKDIYAADKADSLANVYGDPNKLSSAQVNMLAAEVGKIATGGTPSMHELEGITPHTLVGSFGQAAERLTNEPSPAHAAAFVKQYQDYTKALRGDAQKVISDKYGRVIESSKKDLSDDQYNDLNTNYLKRFEPKAAAGLHGKDLP